MKFILTAWAFCFPKLYSLSCACHTDAEEIGISMEEDNGRILIRIRNKVRDPEQINVDKLFERFYKAVEARWRTSSGLEFCIARKLTEKMEG